MSLQLDEALRQISDIRRHMARGGVCRGFRSTTVAFSGVAGLTAAALQPSVVASPEQELGRYLGLWFAVAGLSVCVAGAEILWRTHRTGPGLARRQTLDAVEQFLPSFVVGALLTFTILWSAPEAAWMLPGLWALMFGLGIVVSSRSFPREVLWVAAYYLVCGIGCIRWGQGESALSPWLMAITFGGGQLLGAAVLYWTLERIDGETTTH